MTEQRFIQAPKPQREWLLRCGNGSLGDVVSIWAGTEKVEIRWVTEPDDAIHLGGVDLAHFRDAFLRAVEIVEEGQRKEAEARAKEQEEKTKAQAVLGLASVPASA
jgi:hypothetical protein